MNRIEKAIELMYEANKLNYQAWQLMKDERDETQRKLALVAPPMPYKTPNTSAKPMKLAAKAPAKRDDNRVVRKPKLPKGLTFEPRDGGEGVWRARRADGRRTSFSVAKHGPIKAKRMALAALNA